MASTADDPFDHNGECRFCDELGMHRADCPWLLDRVQELVEYERSFALYHNASMALMHAYKAAHPEVPEDVWPDTTQVNEWAAAEIAEHARLQQAAARLAVGTDDLTLVFEAQQAEIEQLRAEVARLRAALDDIATADSTKDDARALISVAQVALNAGR
jgi:Skp family chaperone for outer membrane proteins